MERLLIKDALAAFTRISMRVPLNKETVADLAMVQRFFEQAASDEELQQQLLHQVAELPKERD